jgi:hypothetical protein
MADEWDGVERRRNVQLLDTSKSLTEDELKELKALAAYSKAARWVIAGMATAAAFLGLDKLSGWFRS